MGVFVFKDPEQLPLDGTKTEGIVYAELDIARGQGTGVMRRDDDKTEYAEIIHPKASETKVCLNYLPNKRSNGVTILVSLLQIFLNKLALCLPFQENTSGSTLSKRGKNEACLVFTFLDF